MAALACGLVPLLGWVLDQPVLQGLGLPTLPLWPITAIGLSLIATALIAMIRGASAGSIIALMLVPMLVGAASLFEMAAGADFGLAKLLFAEQLSRMTPIGVAVAGRPNVVPAMVLILLPIAIVLARRREVAAGRAASLIATLTLAYGTLSLVLIPTYGAISSTSWRFIVTSMPASLGTIALSLGLLSQDAPPERPEAIGAPSPEWKIFQLVMPVILVFPIAVEVFEFLADRRGMLSVDGTRVLGAALNLATFVGLLLWSTRQVMRHRIAQQELAQALESATVALVGLDGRIVHWSRGCEELYGWSADEAIGRYKHELLASQNVEGSVPSEIATRAPHDSQELLEVRRDGTLVRVIEKISEVRFGRTPTLVLSITDIGARVAAEASLAAREAQLRAVLETVPDAMIVLDEQGQIRSFSRTAEDLFGYTQEQVVGRNASMLTAEGAGSPREGFLADCLDPGESGTRAPTGILTAVRVDGRHVPVELQIGEAMVGEERLFTGFIRDISGRIEAEERLRYLNNDLIHASRMNAMGEMAAGLAHELNQPLTAVVNVLAAADMLLQRGDNASEIAELLGMASKQSLRAGAIIRQLRDFVAKRESGMRVEPVEETIREAAALVMAGQNRMDVQVAYAFTPDVHMMLADRIQVQQVMVNLIRNSVEALSAIPRNQRTIAIGTSALDHEMLEISVCDTGPGISPAMMSRIFMPFTSTKGDGGMGVGLSICRRIVESHGGELTAENRPEGGACFRFTLPSIEERERHEHA